MLIHRGSPTTPLSWSGATSFSGRSEDSGRQPTPPKLSGTSRSKILVDSEKTNSKRSRKKKTLAELKNEEKLLLNERRDLKREMAILRLCMETQRATNENLKRIKVELQPCLDKQLESTFASEESTSGQLQMEATAHQVPAVVASDIAQESLTSSAACLEAKMDAKFVLPDLNVPFDEPGCDVILQW
ncbi:adaptive-response sensory-kinase SasA [Striga asiatica]|uniref:Adaptive-response sensory-kinase SasA n=1 Tax=Striga asiatica TaxID=4170 RepID=A0A5A7QT16_STRAF|nr:adaptive-response sensory-kinase SasA [Striga asiatica]